MALENELPKTAYTLHVPITISSSQVLNKANLRRNLNQLREQIRGTVLGSLPLPPQRKDGTVETPDCEVDEFQIS